MPSGHDTPVQSEPRRAALWHGHQLSNLVRVLVAALFATPPAAALADQTAEPDTPAPESPEPASGFTDRQVAIGDAVEQLEPLARAQWGNDTFAGAWIGPGGLGDDIYVAFTEEARSRVQALKERFPFPGLLQPIAVDDSLAELEQAQNALIADRTAAQTGESAISGLEDRTYDLDIDIEDNTVVVITPNPAPGLAQALETRFGTDVEVRQGELMEPYACSRNDCRYDMRAGLSWNSNCTTGFVVQTAVGNRQVLSAGHCGPVGTNAHNGGSRFGQVKNVSSSNRADAERISIEFNNWQGRRWLYKDDNNKDIRITGAQTWDNMVVGTPVCKAGRTTGWTCGDVLSKYYSTSSPNLERQVLTSVNAGPGDSGAPLVREDDNGRALGSLVGGTGDGVVFSHIEYVEKALNANVVTSG